ncbi:MAG: NAD(P)-dependent oxidoreductase [Nitrososphaerota archaeon]|nr:NAD(P)-dependent oxidoreductase [Nitrososphaerota archaeon]MDG6924380.1 NAD(P)-dependent oxidoreductase [Nitrososphaerota archaeon]
MSVLVTGGTGAIGSWVCRKLVEQGHDCVALDISPNKSLLQGVDESHLKIERCDVTDLPSVLDVIKRNKVKQIIHTAAILIEDADRNPGLALKINCGGTMNLLEASRLMDVERFVFTSTGGVLGPTYGEYGHPQYKPMGEDMRVNPVGMYSTTKIFCEGLGLTCNKTYGIDFVAVRFKSLYGPMRHRHATVARVDRLVVQALLGEPMILPANGFIKNDWTYNKDCAKALVLAALSKSLKNRLYHIGTQRGTSLEEVAKIVQRLIPGSKTKVEGTKQEETAVAGQGGVLDITRAKQDMGYTPDFDIEKGLTDYLQVMKEFKLEVIPM